jgi:hypothetical protein
LHKPEVFAGLAGDTNVYLVGTHLVIRLDSYTEVPKPALTIDARAVALGLEGNIKLRKGAEDFIKGAAGGACQLVNGEL